MSQTVDPTMQPFVFKIADREAWLTAERLGSYTGSADDQRDGYIHFSTAAQLAGTLAKHYAGRDGLVLAAVAPASLGCDLKWEPARGGALFPHLYRDLAMHEVAWTAALPLDPDGRHRLPDGVGPKE